MEIEHKDAIVSRPSQIQQPWLITFVDLMFLLLGFFVMLFSMSTIETIRSNAVMNGLTSAFASILPPITDPTPFASLEGEVLARPQFQARIGELFSSQFQVAKVEVIQPGRLMRVAVPTAEMFVEGEARVQAPQYPLLDRVVASLSGRPPGLRFDMEMVLGVPVRDKRDLPTTQTLALTRAGAFAREMTTRGAPPDSVAIGLRAGNPGETVFWFYVRGEDETRLRFLEEEGAAAQETAR